MNKRTFRYTSISFNPSEESVGKAIDKLEAGEYLIRSYKENDNVEKMDVVGFDKEGNEVVVGSVTEKTEVLETNEWKTLSAAIVTDTNVIAVEPEHPTTEGKTSSVTVGVF